MDPDLDAICAAVLASEPSPGGVRIVLIDGPAGAGKTTLAGRLAAALGGVPVLHADDMYEGWEGLPTLTPLLRDQVVGPLSRGQEARFQRWDWHAGARADAVVAPPAPVVIVEGVGTGQSAVRGEASVLVWVAAPTDLRHERWLRREGADTEAAWLRWARAEHDHFLAEGTREAAHVTVDGGQSRGPHAAR
ncbi:hypothetical protein [Demequina sp. NBRC 110057]|uniref:hypothetical protein n=1 Tax=Demequina sp. NBRC 110057 TaxID=1570346 RepID=UPI00117828F5|nr:hypothetical protein [Demequina sp. NBRC 110057]